MTRNSHHMLFYEFSTFACTLLNNFAVVLFQPKYDYQEEEKSIVGLLPCAMLSTQVPYHLRGVCFTVVGKKPSPIFFQHIIYNVFKELIKAEFLISGESDSTSDIC